MIIILVIITAFISISIDYILKLQQEKQQEERILNNAIKEREQVYKQALNY